MSEHRRFADSGRLPSVDVEVPPSLRQRAEAFARNTETAKDLAALAPKDIVRMLHELRVHQIELTMQNEELRRAQEEIDTVRARYFDLYEQAPVGYCTLSEAGAILEINRAAALLLGAPKDSFIKQPLTRFIVRDDQDRYYLYRKQLVKAAATPRSDSSVQEIDGASAGCELRMAKADGAIFWARLETALAREDACLQTPPVERVVLSDISVLKEQQRQLEHIAHYDALTTLPNRVLLLYHLPQAMAQSMRRGLRLAVAYLDLDGFKEINDCHGHDAGDQLLIALAARMKQCLRQGDTLARLGGDEFVAVLGDLAEDADSAPLLARLLLAASQPVTLGERVVRVSGSIGVTFYPQADSVDAEQLLRQADQAMYQAKLDGKNRCHRFDAAHDRDLRARHDTLERIRQALTAHEFVLYYQPEVNMRSGAISSVEALIRWQHPQRGLLLPAAFLPFVEDRPLAIELGEWVIETALTQMERWQADGLELTVSVNVGARQLQQANFVAWLRARLTLHPGIAPSRLVLEILETSAMEDLAAAARIVEDCRDLGVTCALDDFGTGYSSLTYLKRLAVTQLKIDRSFVRDMLDDPEDLAIVESVQSLATAFYRQALAEGVETIEQGELLLQLGCELAQGFGIARPMPAEELPAWVAAWHPSPRWTEARAASRDDLPLLFACVQYRAWTSAIDQYLRGERAAPPPMDRRQCRFGAWLQTEMRAEKRSAELRAIDALHNRTHALAAELLDLQALDRRPEMSSRLGEFHDLRDALLRRMQELLGTRRVG